MAIRSTNANRAAKQKNYDPNARAQGGVSRGDGVDFGASRNPGYNAWQSEQDKWGMSPWYSAGDQMPWSGPPGQQRGQRAPIYTPDAGDPRNAGYWQNQSTPEELAAESAAASQRYAQQRDLLYSDPAYMAAKNAGDLRGQLAAMTALKQKMQQDRFVAQGGTPETWQGRYANENNWPRPGVGGAVPAPAPSGGGRTLPPPAATQALPPSANPMIQGYLGGGAGVPQGPGGFGGFNPMQSKSGMGQSPNMGPAMSTGNPTPAPRNFFATQGRGLPPIGLPTGPRTPINPGGPTQFPISPMARLPFQPGMYGGGLPTDRGGMQMFGYSPYASNPFASMGAYY